jgi:hypothetical protein
MGKSIYSLVLNDEIVDMIDGAAYKKGVSRSTLVNQVLAEYVGYETAEQKARNMFTLIEDLIMGERRMRLLSQNRDSGFSIVSALNYKYSPRVTYAIEIKPMENVLGELVITYRTSKTELIELIERFFAQWIMLERDNLDYDVEYAAGDGKLRRKLYNVAGEESAENVANVLSSYVRNLDRLLNAYINESSEKRDEMLKNAYLQLDTNGKV